nr:4339_t:CDS:2 [Entrophospora candida]
MRSSQLTNSEGTGYKWNINANRDELDVIKNSVDRQSLLLKYKLGSTNNRSNIHGINRGNDESRPSIIITKTHNTVLDELFVTKPTVKNACYRRETSPDVELNDDDLIGGGDDFQTRMGEEQRKAGKGL